MRAQTLLTYPGLTAERSRLAVVDVGEEPTDASPSVPVDTHQQTYLRGLIHEWSRILTTLGITLIPLFFILDVFMMPRELLARFATYRGLTVMIVVGQFLVLRWTQPSARSFLHGYFFDRHVFRILAEQNLSRDFSGNQRGELHSHAEARQTAAGQSRADVGNEGKSRILRALDCAFVTLNTRIVSWQPHHLDVPASQDLYRL